MKFCKYLNNAKGEVVLTLAVIVWVGMLLGGIVVSLIDTDSSYSTSSSLTEGTTNQPSTTYSDPNRNLRDWEMRQEIYRNQIYQQNMMGPRY